MRLWVLLLLPVVLFSTPFPFEANRGQFSSQILYANRSIACTAKGPVFHGGITLALAGARRSTPQPSIPLPSHTTYLLAHSTFRAPHFSEIRYPAVYPGIDLILHGAEYDFRLAPRADPRAIRMRFPGASRITLEGEELAVDSLRHAPPLAWQDTSSGRHYIDVHYRLTGGEVRFATGTYDPALPLVIDPVVIWATYAGGSGADTGTAIAVDSTLNTYVAGTTDSPDFGDAFTGPRGWIEKISATGPSLGITVIAGASIEGLALDPAGNPVVVGSIIGSQFRGASAGAVQSAGATGYVARMSPSLLIATIPGEPAAVAVDSAGAIYVTGAAGPAFQATTGAAQTTAGGGTCVDPVAGTGPCNDAFVLKLSADATRISYATLLGGSASDEGRSVAVNSAGEAYVAGDTASADFPVTPGASQKTINGLYGHAFVAKLNAAGSQFVFATYLGGSAPDIAYGIVVDKNGAAYVTGSTQSPDFPVTPGVYQTKYAGGTPLSDGPDPSGDAFAAKFSPSGSRVWSTYLGGSGRDIAEAIALDPTGNLFIAGTTESTDFPFAADAVRGCRNRTAAPWVAELDNNGAKLLHSTSIGGMGFDEPRAIAVISESRVFVAGDMESRAFFASGNAAQKTYGGGDTDAFAAWLDLAAAPQTYAACVLNAASFQPGNFASFPTGAVAPGEVISIFGLALGPTPAAFAQPAAGQSYPTTLGGTQVLFDGVPAPMWYTSPTQINAVVPYSVHAPVTAMTVQRGGIVDGPRILPVVPAVPGIFTANSAGQGQAAVLNEDGSYNSVTNPAARGSMIVFYVVGAGAMNPNEADGAVQPSSLPLPAPQLPVKVQIRGTDAKVAYAGAAPGYISGLMQVNVEVPTTIDFGNSVPLTISIGGQASQFNVTIAVK
jgi:uncharacterized protein (TIGR03437 family)